MTNRHALSLTFTLSSHKRRMTILLSSKATLIVQALSAPTCMAIRFILSGRAVHAKWYSGPPNNIPHGTGHSVVYGDPGYLCLDQSRTSGVSTVGTLVSWFLALLRASGLPSLACRLSSVVRGTALYFSPNEALMLSFVSRMFGR